MTTPRIAIDTWGMNPPKKLQLVVEHVGHVTRYYQIDSTGGWRIDTSTRQIIVGKGLPRTCIPLDNVLSYNIEEVKPNVQDLR